MCCINHDWSLPGVVVNPPLPSVIRLEMLGGRYNSPDCVVRIQPCGTTLTVADSFDREALAELHLVKRRILIELMTSDRKLRAPGEGSK